MKLDITSLYFNSKTQETESFPDYTLLSLEKSDFEVNQSGARKLLDLINENHIEFTPSSNPNHTTNIERLADEQVIASGKFDSVYVNRKEFKGPFFLLIVDNANISSQAQKALIYNSISVDEVSNQVFYDRVQDYFGKDACWFVHDISPVNGELHMSAIKVSDKSVEYEDVIERKDHWDSLVNNYSYIKEAFKIYLLDIRKLKHESTANSYLRALPKIEIWFKENNLCSENYQILDIRNDNSNIQKSIETNLKDDWHILNQKENGWYGTPWNRWLEFIDWYNKQLEPVFNDSEMLEVQMFIDSCKNSGLILDPELIKRYISSLATKPFVLLSGLSGSGKSKLAEAFAKWICEDEEQYAIIPVGADWTNREPLLGYPNALKDNEYVKPDNDALDLLIRATKNDKKPYFLILDEMNLSHVERYFADFLSTMESNNVIPLHKIKEELNAIPRTIRLPKNLFIVGTVNIDETTYMFSPKVLDRANTIEFRVDYDEIESFLNNPTDVDLEKLNGSGAVMSRSFVRSATQMDDDGNKIVESYRLDPETQKIITSFFKELQKSGAEFGYRTAFEMSKLIFKLKEFGLTEINQQLDIAIMQKMLPKLHGSRSKLSRTLKPLAKLCLYNVEDFDKKYFENFKNIDFKKDENIKYRLSFEKIMRLFNNAVENGFASYAEA